jgi:tetrahydromethanopterin S-methyltransferase subunit E
MTRKRWLALIAVIGAAAAATGCGKDQEVRNYLSNTGPNSLYQWEKAVGVAICELEQHVAGLNPSNRLCPNGPGGPGDKTPPPTYP